MRRAPIVLTATVLGTAGVLLFKPLPVSSLASSTTTTSGSTSDSSSSSSTTGTTATDPTPSAGTAEPSAGATTGTSGTAKDGTWTGTAETIRYGTTQVKVTIAGGRITDVAVVQENQNDSRSVQISENAFPTLREEVLSKQTAAVDTISGATYTSEQYEASLQSALDQAGYTAPDGSTASTSVSEVEGGGFGH